MRSTSHTSRRNPAPTLISALVLALAVSMTLGGTGGGATALPVNSNPHGQSYAQWASDWLTWAVNASAAQSPLTDTTGANAALRQSKGVWFLAGNTGGTTVRNVTIPTGTTLFFPVINEFWITTPGDPAWDQPYFDIPTQTLYATWHDYVIEQLLDPAIDNATYFCTVDGKPVNNLDAFRVLSEVSDSVQMPDNNIFGIPAGAYGPNQSEGIYLMLPPLSAGQHTLHFGGATGGFSLDITYNITVKPGK